MNPATDTINAHGPGAALKILIVDDHAIVREGLKRIIEGASPSWSVTESCSGHQALEQLHEQPFDMAIFDISMPGLDGLALLQRVCAEHRQLRVLMLSMRAEEQLAARAFQAGAKGYVTKDTATQELVAAIRKIAAGGVYVGSALAERLVLQIKGSQSPATHEKLSAREIEVLRRLVRGQRATDIARALHLSIKTVSTHTRRMQDKLRLDGTAALVRYGLEHGFDAEEATAPPSPSAAA